MNVRATHVKITEHALMLRTASHAAALKDSLELHVRRKWMNAKAAHVTIMECVQII